MESKLICYCFGYSEEDINRDVRENNGISSILERILNERKKGTCNCKNNHPEGRRCLGDVCRVADKARKRMRNRFAENEEQNYRAGNL